MNWISATGRKPLRREADAHARDQALGERRVDRRALCRSGSCSPAVARNTPPFTPMSCAQQHDARIGRELIRERLIHGFDECYFLHASLSAASCSRCGSSALGSCANRCRTSTPARGASVARYSVTACSTLRVEVGAPLLLVRLGPGARAHEVVAGARSSGSRRAPALELVCGAVAPRIVGRRVVVHSIGQRLDDVRTAAAACFAERALENVVHGDQSRCRRLARPRSRPRWPSARAFARATGVSRGTEIAQPLLTITKTSGSCQTPARVHRFVEVAFRRSRRRRAHRPRRAVRVGA